MTDTPDPLTDALRRRNTLDGPEVRTIDPEIRTALKFYGKTHEDVKGALPPPGDQTAHGVTVIWTYTVANPDAFLDLLSNQEKALFAAANPAARYGGTYRKFISELNTENHFITLWSCGSLAELGEIGKFADDIAQAAFTALADQIDDASFRQAIYTLAALSI